MLLRPGVMRDRPGFAAIGENMIAQFKQLDCMKTSGILSDEEFAAAMAKLLGV